MAPSSSSMASLSLCLLVLLLAAQHGASSFTTYTQGTQKFSYKKFSYKKTVRSQSSVHSHKTTTQANDADHAGATLPVERQDAPMVVTAPAVTAKAPQPAATMPASPPAPTAAAPPPAATKPAPSPAPTTAAPPPAATVPAPPPAPTTAAPPPAATTVPAPPPAPTTTAPPPAATTVPAPPPAPTTAAPPPAATTVPAPSPAPTAVAPPPATTVAAPSPAPTAAAPPPATIVAAPSPAPTPAAPSAAPTATRIAVNTSKDPRKAPGMLDYSVVISYGTPPQQFQLFLHTSSLGASVLRCKPCASGADNCDPAFDTTASSTFDKILCGTPDCPTNCSAGAVCPLDGSFSVINGTFASDVLTLAPTMAVDDFRFICMDVAKPQTLPQAGTLDLSRDRNSLPSQLSSSWGIYPAATFSYCLPPSPSSEGFLSLGGDTPVDGDDDGNVTVHAPLVTNGNPELASMYLIDLVGISLGDEDLPIPAETFRKNVSKLDVGTTFTMLAPDVYTQLRDSFRDQLSDYNFSSSGVDGFDTCFNFTGLDELVIPNVEFKFGNGENLTIHGDQMLYYDDPDSGPFTMACLAFSSFRHGETFAAVLGAYNLATTEVIYDVVGGKVGFKPWSC